MTTETQRPGTLCDRAELTRILERAVSMTNAYSSEVVDDDMRMLAKVKPLFIGRSCYVWRTKADDEAHFAAGAEWGTSCARSSR